MAYRRSGGVRCNVLLVDFLPTWDRNLRRLGVSALRSQRSTPRDRTYESFSISPTMAAGEKDTAPCRSQTSGVRLMVVSGPRTWSSLARSSSVSNGCRRRYVSRSACSRAEITIRSRVVTEGTNDALGREMGASQLKEDDGFIGFQRALQQNVGKCC